MVKMPDSPCPFCGKKLNQAASSEDPDLVPCENDISICIKCGEVVIFKADGSLRKPSQEEAAEFENDEDIQHELNLVHRMRARHILMTGGNSDE